MSAPGNTDPAGRVLAVGAVNLDTVLRCRHLPRAGETVLATGMQEGFGGKAGNQAVAAARLGARVALVAAVGDDDAGGAARRDLAAQGVDTAGVVVRSGVPTGRATVLVDRAGENTIVVTPGANGTLDAATVAARIRALRPGPADVLLLSGEVAAECAEAAMRAAPGATAVYNLAPFRGLPQWLDELRPVLVLNETEAAQAAGAGLAARFGTVVVTRGAAGAVLVHDGTTHEVPAPPVAVVDTTGAGDAFCGGLAADLASGEPLPRAVHTAVRAGAYAVTGHGARGAVAARADLVFFR